MSIFKGLSAFPITPASVTGEVDVKALTRLLERLKTSDVRSIGLLGSTGTYAYLRPDQRLLAVQTAVEVMQGDKPVIVGVGALRTDDVVLLAREAQSAGADGLLLAPVSYTPLTDEEIFQHYLAVTQAVDLPLCIYNNPGTTGFTFDLPLLARLAALPQIHAVKMPLPSTCDLAQDLSRLRTGLPTGFIIGYSGDWGCGQALFDGADTWFSVIAGLLPDVAVAVQKAATGQDAGALAALDQTLTPMWALFQEFGSLRVVYAMAQLLSLTDCQPPKPILPVPSDAIARVRKALETAQEI